MKNSEGEVEAQNLLGGEVARNVQRILPLLFQTNGGGGVFLTDLRNSVEAQNLRGGGVAHNLVPNGVFCGVV